MHRIKINLIKKAMLLAAAAAGIYGISTAASAFWTDNIDTGSTVAALEIGIEYEEGELKIEDGDGFLPGDMKSFDFKVRNTGDISADIRPVITISCDTTMTIGGAEYLLCNDEGELLKDHDVTYYLSGREVGDMEGTAYDRAVYSRKAVNTLYGNVHKDETLDLDAESGALINEREFLYQLKLSEDCGNEFMGSGAEVSVDTLAVQHRFSENRTGELLDDLWEEHKASSSDAS